MESQETTRELLSKARAGDRAAFDLLAAVHRTRLLAFIRKRLGQHLRQAAEPEDILQETYLKALGSLDRFEWRGEGSLFGWLATTAEYVIRGLGRARKRGPTGLDHDLAGSALSPSRVLRREERFTRLETALDSLTEDHRTVIRLARIEGLPIAEVAQRMGRSPGAVRHLLLRALEKLREGFGEDTASLGLPDRPLGEKGARSGDE